MNPGGTPRSAIAAALVFALSVFAFTLFVWVSFGGSVPLGSKGYRVQVQFGPEASNLFPNAEARISGVRVGKVKSVTTTEGRIDAEIELEPRYAPLRSDSRAIVRSKTLLGESYLELTPGSKAAEPLPEGGRLSQANVQEAQGLDRALAAFDERTRQDFRRFLEGVADALEDRGADANAALGNAPLALGDLRKLVDVLDRQRGAVRTLVRDAGTALQTIADRGDDAQAVAVEGSRLLKATADRDEELTETVRAMPALLRTLRSFSGDVEAISRDAGPALRELAPVAPLVEPGLREARRIAPDLRSVMRSLGRTADAAEKGLPGLTRIVRTAGPLLDVLEPAGKQLVPVVKTLEDYREDGVTALVNTGSALQASLPREGREPKHYLRTVIPLGNELPFGVATANGSHRHNPYLRPGGVQDMIDGKPFKAFDCRNASNSNIIPPLGSAPPCLQQEPFSVGGSKPSQFPQIPPLAGR